MSACDVKCQHTRGTCSKTPTFVYSGTSWSCPRFRPPTHLTPTMGWYRDASRPRRGTPIPSPPQPGSPHSRSPGSNRVRDFRQTQRRHLREHLVGGCSRKGLPGPTRRGWAPFYPPWRLISRGPQGFRGPHGLMAAQQCWRPDTRAAVEHRPADVVSQPLVVEHELARRLRAWAQGVSRKEATAAANSFQWSITKVRCPPLSSTSVLPAMPHSSAVSAAATM